MTSSAFCPSFECLPKTIPIFPLSGVLLLPRGKLPLNIFEPRYINMIDDALAADRMIGMIQPRDASVPGSAKGFTPVYDCGCAGRITRLEETEDGRYLLTLVGICRFGLTEELTSMRGYRRVVPAWTSFRDDLQEPTEVGVDRDRLVGALTAFFDRHGINANWEVIEATPDDSLITSLCMICPFEPSEKQALLEAGTAERRAEMMISLMEMAVLDKDGADSARH